MEYDLSKVEPEAPHGLGTKEIYLHDWHHEGGVWFFKSSALYYIDPKTLTIKKSIKLPRRVGQVGRDRDGLVWDGGWSTREIHLYRTDGKIQQRILAPMGHIEDIFQQPGESIVWIGANTLASYDKATGQWGNWSQSEGGSFKGFAVAPSLTKEPILWMYPISKAGSFGFDLKNKRFAYRVSTLELPMAEHPVAKSKIVVCRGKKFDGNTDLSGTWRVSEWMNVSYFQDGDFAASIHPEHWLKLNKTVQNTWQGKQVRTYARCRTETYNRLNIVGPDSIHAIWTALDGNWALAKGLSYKMAAAELDISTDTVRSHVRKIYDKLHVHSLPEAISKAFLK